MSLAMTKQERERFLADVHVGVISMSEDGRAPLAVPIWYAYEPGGELTIITARTSRKGKLLEKAGRFSLCTQTETPPYKYVSIEGPIVGIDPVNLERHERPMAHRYLGKDLGDKYIAATEADRTRGVNVLIRMRPEHWLSVDYSKQFAAG